MATEDIKAFFTCRSVSVDTKRYGTMTVTLECVPGTKSPSWLTLSLDWPDYFEVGRKYQVSLTKEQVP